MRWWRRLHDDEGATAIEYAVCVSAIAALIVAVAYSIGAKALDSFFRFGELFSSF